LSLFLSRSLDLFSPADQSEIGFASRGPVIGANFYFFFIILAFAACSVKVVFFHLLFESSKGAQVLGIAFQGVHVCVAAIEILFLLPFFPHRIRLLFVVFYLQILVRDSHFAFLSSLPLLRAP